MLSERQRGTVSETRKITKSAMEKKRRARINTSLVELKTILAGMISHKSERFEKMEKADILEMTVKYVKQLQRNSEKLSDKNKTKDEQYKNGVNNCISEVIKYIASSDSCDAEIKSKLLDHLANRLSGVETAKAQNQDETASPVSQIPSDDMSNDDTDNNRFSPVPLTVNTSTVCPAVLTASPGGQQPQFAVQGHYTALPTGSVVNALQPASPVVSNIPLTIIVPANFYTSTPGTTCVIPLNIPACATKQVQNSPELRNGLLNTVTGLPGRSAEVQHSLCNIQQSPTHIQTSDVVKNTNCTSVTTNNSVQDSIDRRPTAETQQKMPRNINGQRHKRVTSQYSPEPNSDNGQPRPSPDSLWRPWSKNDS